jgi:hypothetical protein
MLEQLHTVLAGATYSSTGIKEQARGLASHCGDELAALGVNMSAADTGTATTVEGAILAAKATVNAQSLTATFAGQQKSMALGKLDQYGTQLASLGLT